jgi:hypothetical protein
MGELEPAVKLLVESEPEEENFLSDQHLACLISTVAASGTVLYHRVPTPLPHSKQVEII